MRLFAPVVVVVAASALISAFGFASVGQAAVYGDFVGSTVTFEGVQDQNALFGAPVVSGDTLDFNPNTFEAQCPTAGCTGGSLLVDDTLTFTIQANAGQFIDDIMLSEAGDTTLATFIPNDLAVSSVSAAVFIDILEIDGVSVNNINANDTMVFTNGGSWTREYGTDGVGTTAEAWTGALDIDLDAIIAAAGQTGQATRVTLNIDNTLTVFAGDGLGGTGAAQAFIEKKDFDGLAVTVVPEPGTALLMGLGLAGLAAIRRND